MCFPFCKYSAPQQREQWNKFLRYVAQAPRSQWNKFLRYVAQAPSVPLQGHRIQIMHCVREGGHSADRLPSEGLQSIAHRPSSEGVYSIARLHSFAPRFTVFLILFLCGILCGSVRAQNSDAQSPETQKKHHFLFMQYSPGNRIVELSDEGKILWEHPMPGLAVMFERLKNGNIVYAYGGSPTGVQEVDREHHVLWNYTAKCEQVLGFSRLPNGNILVGEQGPCQAVEVNRKGEEVHTTPLTTNEKPAHRQLRSLHKLSNGNILSCHEADATVREVTPEGKVVWEYPHVENVFEAVRLKNGNTLIGCSAPARVIEVTKEGKTVWEFGANDAPELGLIWITGIQRLKNGNLVVANFLRGNEGKGVHAFEVTRDKKVVWTFANHEMATLVTMVKVLDEPEIGQ